MTTDTTVSDEDFFENMPEASPDQMFVFATIDFVVREGLRLYCKHGRLRRRDRLRMEQMVRNKIHAIPAMRSWTVKIKSLSGGVPFLRAFDPKNPKNRITTYTSATETHSSN